MVVFMLSLVIPIQLIVVNIPVVFKEHSTYQAVLEYLKDQDVEAPSVCHLDFEAGKHKALKDVYPSTRIIGCNFHWKQVLILNFYGFLNNLFLFRPFAQTWGSTAFCKPTTMMWILKCSLESNGASHFCRRRISSPPTRRSSRASPSGRRRMTTTTEPERWDEELSRLF